jgi:hypothetical protein
MCSCVASNRPTAAAACQRLDSLVSQFDSYQMSLGGGGPRQTTCSPEALQTTCSHKVPPSSSSPKAPPPLELVAAYCTL